MTPGEFRAALDAIGWSRRHLTETLGCDRNLGMRWARGDAVIPPSLGYWLESLAAAHVALPVPDDWRVLKRVLCVDCGTRLADPPSKLCPGCEAYREHAGSG